MNSRFDYKFYINMIHDLLDTSIIPLSPTSPVKNAIINNGINNSVDTIKSDDLTQQSTSHLTEMDKKIRNLSKKLRQIEELKERQKNGDKLELTQVLQSSNFFFQ